MQDWVVTDYLGHNHLFLTAAAAADFAFKEAYSDRGTTVRSPDGDEWVVVRRHPAVNVAAWRQL